MGLLGGIGLMAAIANYNSAKKAYDAAVEKEKGLQAAVQAAIANRDKAYEGATDGVTNQNKPLNGVVASTILRIGNLANARAFQRMQVVVVLKNETTDKTFTIRSVEALTRINNIALPTLTTQRRGLNAYLKPGQTLQVELPGSKVIVPNPPKDDLKATICAACKRRLITSCWEVDIKGIETADIAFEYTSKSGADSVKRARYVDAEGVVRYMRESFYPSEI